MISKPSVEHEVRVQVLEDLATMMGFPVRLDSLPDGSKPDAYRFDPVSKGVFLGEAKASETPNSSATRKRFLNYLDWLGASRAAVGSSVCAICFGRHRESEVWRAFLTAALKKAHLPVAEVRISWFDHDLGLVWAKLGN